MERLSSGKFETYVLVPELNMGLEKSNVWSHIFTDFKQKLTLRVQIFRMRLGGHSTWQRAKILNIKNYGVTNT